MLYDPAMIVKMKDGSPAWLAAAGPLRNRFAGFPMLPTQLRRWVPPYIACVIIFLFMLNMDIFHSRQAHEHDAMLSMSGGSFTSDDGPDAPIDPSRLRSDFPKKIWQTWKVHPLAFDEREIETGRTWLGKNPDFRYEVLTDWNDVEYVRWHYGPEGHNRPDIVSFYESVSAAIVKADLLRYLIIYAEGGVYTDVDVDALKGVRKWIPERFHAKDLDMVIGIEIDEPDWKDHPILGPKSRSFCQWTFMAKPHVPVMLRLVEHIMTWLNGVAKKQGVPLSKVDLDFDEIISGTGPSAFTNAIMDEMNKHRAKDERAVTWDEFHDMQEAKVIGRVLVLTVEAFAAGQGHSNSGTHDARAALVRHHYHASNWPSKHHRYSHPVYGEVEICNWEDECVKKWDANVAAYDKLSKTEQQKLIDEKEKQRIAEEEEEFRLWEEEEQRRKEEEEEQKKKEEEQKKKEEDEDDAVQRKSDDQQRQHQQQVVSPNTGAGASSGGNDADDSSPAAR